VEHGKKNQNRNSSGLFSVKEAKQQRNTKGSETNNYQRTTINDHPVVKFS